MPGITAAQPLTFKAVWTDGNKHLADTTLEKITRCAFYIINRIITALVLPATLQSKESIQKINRRFEEKWQNSGDYENVFLRNNFSRVPIEVTTPNDAVIRGTFFKNVMAREGSPTVVFFQPNGMLYKQGTFDWVMEQAALQEFPYNFVFFDYRGCDGESYGPGSGKDLYLDGESIYQFVRDKLQVHPSAIHFYGFSLGGGVSSGVKEIHPECNGNYVNERSFVSILHAIANMVPNLLDRSPVALHERVKSVFAKAMTSIACAFVSLLNWNMPSAKAIENLKGKTLIVHHPKDELMKEEASLYRHFFERQTAPASGLISHLDLSRCKHGMRFYHGTPLPYFRTHEFNPASEVTKFLFSSNLSYEQRMAQIYRNSSSIDFRNKVHEAVASIFQGESSYWGSGEDACNNRNGLSLSDSHLAYAVYNVKMGVQNW